MEIEKRIEEAMLSMGNTWATLKELNESHTCITGIDNAIRKGDIYYYQNNETPMFTLPSYAIAENMLAKNIASIRNYKCRQVNGNDGEIIVKKAMADTGLNLCQEQQDAVRKSLNTNVLILTGGPGTGKTTTLSVILKCQEALGYTDIILAAPTGKASKRMTESTGRYAATLHNVLQIREGHMEPKKLTCDCIVIDEISMLDLDVANALFRAVKPGMRVIMLGDTDQLPSVGAGAVLRDMINSGCIPVAKLLQTHRQGGDSMIFKNFKGFREGKANLYSGWDKDNNGQDVIGQGFHAVAPTQNFSAVQLMLYYYKKEYDRLGGWENVVILTPYRNEQYKTSSEYLNKQIQHIVNPTGNECKSLYGTFRVGDPIMCLVNEEHAVNGDVGEVIGARNDSITVKYVDCTITYKKKELDEGKLTLAYAMSIHKSQGSEYQSVITCMLNEHGSMLQRNLLYTAVTRAKKNCILICNEEAVEKAVANEMSSKRTTLLTEKIRHYCLRSSLMAA